MFIVWTRYDRRPDLLAQHLGATVRYIYYGERGKVLQAPFRYVAQLVQTWRVLRQERPDVILVQNPPIFCVLEAFVYAWWHKARYVIDSHSAAFLSPKWRWSLPLHRLLSRRAAMTIVPNDDLAQIVRQWDCPTCVLGFTPGEYPEGEDFPLSGAFNVAVVCVGAEDEPLDVVFEAASHLPEVSFYVTGESSRLPAHFLAKKPANCHLTGYIPYAQYIGLLRGADAVIDLTTRDHTLLMGGFEAISLGTPLIVSNWPVLRNYFSQGTIHVSNTVEGVCEGVRRAQREQQSLRRDIVKLREQLEADWRQKFTELQALLGQSL